MGFESLLWQVASDWFADRPTCQRVTRLSTSRFLECLLGSFIHTIYTLIIHKIYKESFKEKTLEIHLRVRDILTSFNHLHIFLSFLHSLSSQFPYPMRGTWPKHNPHTFLVFWDLVLIKTYFRIYFFICQVLQSLSIGLQICKRFGLLFQIYIKQRFSQFSLVNFIPITLRIQGTHHGFEVYSQKLSV